MQILFRRSTHDENGNYKFHERDQEGWRRAREEGLDWPPPEDVGLVHSLSPKKWMTLSEIVAEVREYEATTGQDGLISQNPPESGVLIHDILINLAYLVENGYAEAKEVP
jgi:hypothetical protein